MSTVDTVDTILDDELNLPVSEGEQYDEITPSPGVEFFECQKCSEWNIIKNKPTRRRTTKVRHMRLDNVTYASLKRYAMLNNTTINYAIMLLLHTARTSNVNYIVNERHLVDPAIPKKKK